MIGANACNDLLFLRPTEAVVIEERKSEGGIYCCRSTGGEKDVVQVATQYPTVMKGNQWRKGVVISKNEIKLLQHRLQNPIRLN